MENIEVYQKALLKWGYEAQLDMAIEEFAELTQAICKVKRKGLIEAQTNLIEEMVDAQIMLEQLKIVCQAIPDFDQKHEETLNKKLKRLDEMLK